MAYCSVCLQIQDSSVVIQVSDITGMFLSNFPKKVWGHGDCRWNWRIWLILQALPMHQYTEILSWLYIFSAILGFYHQLYFMVVWVLGKEQRAMQIWSPPMLPAVRWSWIRKGRSSHSTRPEPEFWLGIRTSKRSRALLYFSNSGSCWIRAMNHRIIWVGKDF